MTIPLPLSMSLRWLALLAVVLVAGGCPNVAGTTQVDLGSVRLPPGFRIAVYADNLPGARSLALGPGGTLFVGTRDLGGGSVYAVVDRDSDQRADQTFTLAKGLDAPNGVAVLGGALYVAEPRRLIRFDDIEARLASPPAPVVVSTEFPSQSLHGWKYLRLGPDGWLYVPIGAPCDVCERDDPRFSTIMRMRPDGSDLQVYASGIRNTVGFDFHPQTGELWFTENGRDGLGDHAPPDELNHAPRPGMHFGFPYCHGDIDDPDRRAYGCAQFTPPVQLLEPHAAALGMRFYTGSMFPDSYKGQIFIAEHGSARRSDYAGYRISRVRLVGNTAVEYQPFAEGFLQGDKSWARPVDVLVMPDGALLFSDDRSGAVYRISYSAG